MCGVSFVYYNYYHTTNLEGLDFFFLFPLLLQQYTFVKLLGKCHSPSHIIICSFASDVRPEPPTQGDIELVFFNWSETY